MKITVEFILDEDRAASIALYEFREKNVKLPATQEELKAVLHNFHYFGRQTQQVPYWGDYGSDLSHEEENFCLLVSRGKGLPK